MKFDTKKTGKEIFAVVMRDISAYGGFPFYAAMIVVFFLLNNFDFAYTLLISLIAVTVVIAVIRLAYFKARPGMKKKKYNTLYERIDNSSFPSIHAARAVMISIALFSQFNELLPLLALLIILVYTSRVYFRRHDTWDLVAGTIVGLALGFVFF